MSKIKYLDFANYVEENRQSLIDHCRDNGKNVDSNQSLEQIVQINNTINLDTESTERPMRKVFNYDGTLLESSIINIGDEVYLPDYEPPIYDDRLEFDRWINTTNQTTAKYDYSIAPIMRVKEQIDLDGTLVRPTLIDISLNDSTQLSPTIKYQYGTTLTKTAYIDWGDDTVDELINSSSSKQHTYSQTGNYTIKMYSKSTSFTPYTSSNSSFSFGNSYYQNCITKVYLGDVATINSYAFASSKNMSILTIPSMVKQCGAYIAYHAYSLKFIALTSSLISTASEGYYAFNSSGLENLILEHNFKFGQYLFCNCSNIGMIIIPDNANLSSPGIFSNCQNISKVVLPNTYTISNATNLFSNINVKTLNLSNIKILDNSLCSSCQLLSNVILSNNLNTIGSSCFSYCYNLQSLKLPESLEQINSTAFLSSGISNIKLPSNLKMLGENCFSQCLNLLELIIPDSVQSIGTSCFSDCSSLKKLILPNNWSKNINFIQRCASLSNESYISMGKRIADLTNQTASIITFNNYQKSKCDIIKVNAETGEEDENGISLTQFIQNKNWTITISG